MQHRQRFCRETGPDLSGKEKFLVPIIADQNRAKVFPRSLRRRVSANHEFLLVHAFEFDPRAASTPRFVRRVALFTNETFEPAALHFRQQLGRVGTNLARKTDRIGHALAKFREEFLALSEWKLDQALAVELQQIEHVEADRRFSPFQLESLQKLK